MQNSAIFRLFPVGCAAALAVLLCSCSSYKGDFVYKSEAELERMETEDSRLHKLFMQQNYPEVDAGLRNLTRERTVSQPLYQYEAVSVLLMQGRRDEAHAQMLKLKETVDFVSDEQLNDKAKSLWHGEQNKVFKGDPYERSTLNALLAASFLERGDAESALACVKSGLLYDGDTAKGEFSSDYALLQALGALCHRRLGDDSAAREWNLRAMESLRGRGFMPCLDASGAPVLAGSSLEPFSTGEPNALLVIWTGTPPSMRRTGEYGETRFIQGGKGFYDAFLLSGDGVGTPVLLPRMLADLNYQALTRGPRMMNDILAEKAFWKAFITVTSTAMFATGTALVANCGGDAVLLSVGLGLVVGGSIGYVVAVCINPSADIRYWKNLPGELVVCPLRLPPGRQKLRVAKLSGVDEVSAETFEVDVRPGVPLNVFHLRSRDFDVSALTAAQTMRWRLGAAAVGNMDFMRAELSTPAVLAAGSRLAAKPDNGLNVNRQVFQRRGVCTHRGAK